MPAPPASVFRASRPTTVPLDAAGSFAFNSAAAPATIAAEAEVPVTLVVPEVSFAEIPTPGAEMNAASPEFEPDQRVSSWFVAATPTTFASPAG